MPTARIGGCNITGGGMRWLNAFIKHCLKDTNYATGKIGSPLDAILFHAKGSPRFVNGMVVMGISNQLRNIDNNFKLISTFPQLKNLPVIIGESDPEGCAACGMSTNPENAYRNGTMYSSYTAASFARKYQLADRYGTNLLGAVSWSFEFENQPWFAGFRDLATNGVDKPVLNVFRMFGMMKGKRIPVEGSQMYPLQNVLDSGIRKTNDIGALASKDSHSAAVMIWNYHDEDKQDTIGNAIQLSISNLAAKKIKLTLYQIDYNHSNSYETWKKMGSPQQPTTAQIAELEKSGQLEMIGKPESIAIKNNSLSKTYQLPRQAVALVKLDW